MGSPALTGSVDDPDFRRRRAQHAAKSRTTLDHHVARVVENAPRLTPEQIDRLRALLPSVPVSEPEPDRYARLRRRVARHAGAVPDGAG